VHPLNQFPPCPRHARWNQGYRPLGLVSSWMSSVLLANHHEPSQLQSCSLTLVGGSGGACREVHSCFWILDLDVVDSLSATFENTKPAYFVLLSVGLSVTPSVSQIDKTPVIPVRLSQVVYFKQLIF